MTYIRECPRGVINGCDAVGVPGQSPKCVTVGWCGEIERGAGGELALLHRAATAYNIDVARPKSTLLGYRRTYSSSTVRPAQKVDLRAIRFLQTQSLLQ